MIIPNASSDERSSPFYKSNEDFCNLFENYIAEKDGRVKGSYNAWSYHIFGQIDSPHSWELMYKKSTFSTSGNLLLSSKHQSLLSVVVWETEIKGTQDNEFQIRKKDQTDFLKRVVNKSLSELSLSEKYILETKNSNLQIISKLTEILQSLIQSGDIYKIELRNEKLKIEMRTEKHHFEILERLMAEIQKDTYTT